MVKSPYESATERVTREALRRADEVQRLLDSPTMKAVRDHDSALMKAVRDAQHSPMLRALKDADNSSILKTIEAADNSSILKTLRAADNSALLRLASEAEHSPILKAVRDALERDNELRSLAEGPIQRVLREAGLEGTSRGALDDIHSREAGLMPPTDGRGALSGTSWAQPRRSEELRRVAEEAGRGREAVSREIENIEPDAEDGVLEELEELRAALAEEEKGSRRAARLERHRERKAEADYWFRQWMNSLAIGNGAAFLAVTAGLLQASRLERALALVYAPLAYFALGLLFAGAVRLFVWSFHASPFGSKRQSASRAAGLFATVVSAVLFAAGVISSVVEVTQFNQVAERIAARTAVVEGQELQIREFEAAEKLVVLRAKFATAKAKAADAAKATAPPPAGPAKSPATTERGGRS